MVNYHKKKGKGKLPLFCGNGEQVITIYDIDSDNFINNNNDNNRETNILVIFIPRDND